MFFYRVAVVFYVAQENLHLRPIKALVDHIPVSYTHLDVYKRQLLWYVTAVVVVRSPGRKAR